MTRPPIGPISDDILTADTPTGRATFWIGVIRRRSIATANARWVSAAINAAKLRTCWRGQVIIRVRSMASLAPPHGKRSVITGETAGCRNMRISIGRCFAFWFERTTEAMEPVLTARTTRMSLSASRRARFCLAASFCLPTDTSGPRERKGDRSQYQSEGYRLLPSHRVAKQQN